MTTQTIPQSVVVIGRRWFNTEKGHSYYSAQTVIDGEFGPSIPYDSGYDEYYLHGAMMLLCEKGLIPPREQGESFFSLARRVGFKLAYTVSDVARKRDL